jgi:hypothetical protein
MLNGMRICHEIQLPSGVKLKYCPGRRLNLPGADGLSQPIKIYPGYA